MSRWRQVLSLWPYALACRISLYFVGPWATVLVLAVIILFDTRRKRDREMACSTKA